MSVVGELSNLVTCGCFKDESPRGCNAMVVQAVEIPIRLSLVPLRALCHCLVMWWQLHVAYACLLSFALLSSLCLLVVLCVVAAWHKF